IAPTVAIELTHTCVPVATPSATCAGQNVTINYQAQVADGVATGTQVCVNSIATVGAIVVGGVKACATVNCQSPNPGVSPQAASPVSDQRTGSVLVCNFYTSIAPSPAP